MAVELGVTISSDLATARAELDAAAEAGYRMARVIVDWSACQPDARSVDDNAVRRHVEVLASARERGLEPLIVLYRATEPAWVGEEFWLWLQSPEVFAVWAAAAARAFGDHCSRWTTLDNPNGLALQTWLIGTRPPRRKLDIAATVRSLDHMLAAHVLAADAIHDVQSDATVGMNLFALSAYELSRLLLDVLVAPGNGVPREDLRGWLEARRELWYQAIGRSATPGEGALRRIARSAVQLEMALPRAAGAAYLSSQPSLVDVVQLDYHQPEVGRYVLLPGRRHVGGRRWLPLGERGEVDAAPADLTRYCAAMHEPGMDIWLIQNGDPMWEVSLASAQEAAEAGVPVTVVCGPEVATK